MALAAVYPEGIDVYYDNPVGTISNEVAIDPHSLDTLMVLAGANASLDRMRAAHKATHEILIIKTGFSLKEFFKSQPYKNSQDLEKVITVLHKAGLPE